MVLRIIKGIAKFAIAFVLMTILCAVVWEEFIDGVLYHCTDDICGYLIPDGFVHNWDGHPITVVKEIHPDDDMSHPDTIKEGWTQARLWCLWGAFVGASVVVSVLLARISWEPGRWRRV